MKYNKSSVLSILNLWEVWEEKFEAIYYLSLIFVIVICNFTDYYVNVFCPANVCKIWNKLS